MEPWQLVIFGVAGFTTSILSGISGAGGGFIMTPLAIFLGLSPAEAVATGKLSGLSTTVGSLSGMRKSHKLASKKKVIPVMVLALVVGLLVPYIIKSLDNDIYKTLLGVLLIFMIPIVIIRKVGVKPHHPKIWQKYVGAGLLTISLVLQGAFSGGLGTLVNLVLMGLMGMSALEANITKRWSQVILNITIFLGVVGSGLIVWSVVPVAVASTFAGSLIGGHMAEHKGDEFIMKVMVALMFVSGIALIIG